MCAINRASMYILLSILVNLCALTYKLAVVIGGGKKPNQTALNVASTTVPILLGILGYALEVEIGEGDNAQLNTVRTAIAYCRTSLLFGMHIRHAKAVLLFDALIFLPLSFFNRRDMRFLAV